MTGQRKKKGRFISGWIILDKPKGLGSTEAVSIIKRLYNAKKAGHAGTLDPLASGLLPVALGEATKTVPYVMAGTKVYHFTVAWGEERVTDDLEGEVIKFSEDRPKISQIKALLPRYTGVILQTPPQFSAVRINGLRAYNLARQGKNVEIPSREVKIYRLELLESTRNGCTTFKISCSKGTYVRALARDMGRELGCYGYITDLRRTEVFPFLEDNIITFEKLKEACSIDIFNKENLISSDFSQLDSLLVETEKVFSYLPQYSVTREQALSIQCGNFIPLHGQYVPPIKKNESCIIYKGKVLAVGWIEKDKFYPKQVFRIGIL